MKVEKNQFSSHNREDRTCLSHAFSIALAPTPSSKFDSGVVGKGFDTVGAIKLNLMF